MLYLNKVMTEVEKKSNKRTRSPERKKKRRENNREFNMAYIFYWFLILILVGRTDTDNGNSPNNPLIYTGLYILLTIAYLIIKANMN